MVMMAVAVVMLVMVVMILVVVMFMMVVVAVIMVMVMVVLVGMTRICIQALLVMAMHRYLDMGSQDPALFRRRAPHGHPRQAQGVHTADKALRIAD